jgi:hypothetical protein
VELEYQVEIQKNQRITQRSRANDSVQVARFSFTYTKKGEQKYEGQMMKITV